MVGDKGTAVFQVCCGGVFPDTTEWREALLEVCEAQGSITIWVPESVLRPDTSSHHDPLCHPWLWQGLSLGPLTFSRSLYHDVVLHATSSSLEA